MNTMKIARSLNDCELFKDFDASALSKLSQMFGVKALEPGQMLFEQDTPGRSLFVIFAGHVDLFILREMEEVPVATLAPGQSFGELALLCALQHHVCARARDELTVFELSRGTLNMLETSDPALALDVIAKLRRRVAGVLERQMTMTRGLFLAVT